MPSFSRVKQFFLSYLILKVKALQSCKIWHHLPSDTVSHLRRHCSAMRTQNPNTTFSYLPFTLYDDPSCYIFYLPLMQPGNLCLMAVSMSSSDIQLPRPPLTPAFGVGMASWRSLVHMNVRLSTRATSAGLVRASQLNVEEMEMFLEII